MSAPTLPGTDRALRVNRLLFRLAGRLDDEDLAVLRSAIADAEDEDEARAVPDHLLTNLIMGGLPLTWEDIQLVAEEAGAFDPEDVVAQLMDEPPPLEYRFGAPGGPAPAALRALLGGDDVSSVVGVWLGERHGPDDADPVPVWLVETVRDADPVDLTAELQQRLAETGEIPPRVEVFAEGEELPPYHRAALETAVLQWTDPTLPTPRLARVFDGVDADGRAYFAADHPVVEGEERDRLVAYLGGAELLLGDLGDLDDVVDPGAPGAVPMGFRSDGTWVWTDAVTYYLEKYGLAPDPELARHVWETDGPPPRPGRIFAGLAVAALVEDEDEETEEW